MGGLVFSEMEARELGINVDSPPKKKKNKYNAQKAVVDGIRFDSSAEANYYIKLKYELNQGLIEGFCRQARFIVTEGRNGNKGTEYVTDFIIFYPDGSYRIVDVKGVQTPVFKLKIKCFKEKYPKLKIELED